MTRFSGNNYNLWDLFLKEWDRLRCLCENCSEVIIFFMYLYHNGLSYDTMKRLKYLVDLNYLVELDTKA